MGIRINTLHTRLDNTTRHTKPQYYMREYKTTGLGYAIHKYAIQPMIEKLILEME